MEEGGSDYLIFRIVGDCIDYMIFIRFWGISDVII